jgi:thiol:disulfide interchange protein
VQRRNLIAGMVASRLFTIAACALVFATGMTARSQERRVSALPDPTARFDPARDAESDIKTAVAEAKRTNRRVILDVGGEWCGWCHTLDRYFADHPELRGYRDAHYVWLKINMSPENENQMVLSRYPHINGYPHLFVLDQDGKLLQSQDTSPLESGPSYDLDRMTAFLNKWAADPAK